MTFCNFMLFWTGVQCNVVLDKFVIREAQSSTVCLRNTQPCPHTHNHLTALCPGLPGWAGTRKVKPIWIWLKQVCTSLQTDNHASTPPLSFYRPDALPAAQPTASKHSRQSMPQNKQPFNGPLSGSTQVSQYQKGNTNLDFTEARDSEWQ